MIELAEIFRRHGAEYRARYQNRLPSSQLRAMRDIEDCRTAVLGGQVYYCAPCRRERYSYHSCKNRHCPKCQNENAQQWLEKQCALLLPAHYFLVTVTLPSQLRHLAGRLPKTIYSLLFQSAAAALLKLARDPKYLGGLPALIGILHSWRRDLLFHPHIHFLVTGGGLSPDAKKWRWTAENYLLNVEAFSIIFRAKFREALKKAGLLDRVPLQAWIKKWVVHAKAVGNGEATLKYLAPYIFRAAISNNRIEKLEAGQVTFRYRDNNSKLWMRRTLKAEEFIRRFLQHVLPKGFIKVRYYGLLSPRKRRLLEKARKLLGAGCKTKKDGHSSNSGVPENERSACRCPKCGTVMTLLRVLLPHLRGPP